MRKKLLILNNGNDTIYWLIIHNNNIDFHKAFQSVKDRAKKENFSGYLSETPSQWWYDAGLVPMSLEILNHPNTYIRPKRDYDKYKIERANCYDCNSCEDNICMQYGGIVTADDNIHECLHGENLYNLIYDKNIIAQYSAPKPVPLSPAEIAELLQTPEFKQIPKQLNKEKLSVKPTF